MNEETQDVTSDIPDELITLKNRADKMGITYHPNIGLDKLKAKVNNKLSPEEKVTNTLPTAKKGKKLYLTHEEFIKETAAELRKNINKQVRVRVMCMNPNKTEWEGEIISVGSAKLGTFKKYVPFNHEAGWHIPFIMYEAMKERMYTSYNTVRGPRGEKIRKGKLVPEFNIQVLPPLTPAELADMAKQQVMTGSAG